MKTIELKTVTETHNGAAVELSTVELIRICARNTPPGGFTVDEIIDRMRILKLLDSVGDATELKIEDADFENLKKYVREVRWNVISEAIVEFSKLFV